MPLPLKPYIHALKYVVLGLILDKIISPECPEIQNILNKRAARLLWPNWPMALLSTFTLTLMKSIAPGMTPIFYICEDIHFKTDFQTENAHEQLEILKRAQIQFKTLKFSTTPLAVL